MSRRDRRGWRDRLHVHWPKNDKSQDDGSDRSSFMSSPSTMRNRVLPVRQSDSQTKDVAGGSGEKHEIDAEELTKEHNTLWNEAYDAIRSDKEKAKYLDLYEKIVARRFLDDENDGVHRDRDEREKQMKEMVKLGLERVQKAKRFTEKYESVFDFTKPFKAILDIPLKSIPQTALPWAVISSTLDVGVSCQFLVCTDEIRYWPSQEEQMQLSTVECRTLCPESIGIRSSPTQSCLIMWPGTSYFELRAVVSEKRF